ncbi:MAG: response regulator, partial [Chlamydiia bacterium]|nr:response regulator [Chlamydiia bacterium]
LGRQLGKKVRLVISGKSTQVDRDILEKLESPLGHLVRNALDHGIESPQERQLAGKPEEGVVTLEARHQGGMLAISVIDDGRGIDIELLRDKIVEKKLVDAQVASQLSPSEILDFLFLPSFSTSPGISEISGRGVGLDIVQSVVHELGGGVRVSFEKVKGARFDLQLPVTLSVIRALHVEISGEPYAFPLARIDKALWIDEEKIERVENRQFFHQEGQNIGLISAWQVLDLPKPQVESKRLSVIIVSDHQNRYGLVVDRLIGEKEFVLQELDPRFGKIPDILAGSVMEDGSPVLIIDVEDIVRSADHLLTGGREALLTFPKSKKEKTRGKKKILIVDDSMTVREVESRLLANRGYEVETAVDGIDGWNAIREDGYDLVITDVDMPRMNGIELLKLVKSDPKFSHLPILIVSYKGDEEERLKGLAAGADYYLTKSSFHDTTLFDAVVDLIGNPG